MFSFEEGFSWSSFGALIFGVLPAKEAAVCKEELIYGTVYSGGWLAKRYGEIVLILDKYLLMELQ